MTFAWTDAAKHRMDGGALLHAVVDGRILETPPGMDRIIKLLLLRLPFKDAQEYCYCTLWLLSDLRNEVY